jgi:hypothetical protein
MSLQELKEQVRKLFVSDRSSRMNRAIARVGFSYM